MPPFYHTTSLRIVLSLTRRLALSPGLQVLLPPLSAPKDSSGFLCSQALASPCLNSLVNNIFYFFSSARLIPYPWPVSTYIIIKLIWLSRSITFLVLTNLRTTFLLLFGFIKFQYFMWIHQKPYEYCFLKWIHSISLQYLETYSALCTPCIYPRCNI